MNALPLRVKEALKTGLAMVLACGCAMGLGWDNPYWACIAVAVVSLPTIGESLNKSMHRIGGTVLGAAVALGCIAIFPQDRWLFFTVITVFMGFCAYRITLSRYVYFWFISGYVAILLAANVSLGARLAFYTAVYRVQETCLGILVYALVSVFIWPQRCANDLAHLVKSLVGVQAKILDHAFALMLGGGDSGDAGQWYALEAQLLGQLTRRLDAAEAEQFEIHEARHWWRAVVARCQGLMEGMDLWREGFSELRHLDIATLLPELAEARGMFRRRFAALAQLVETKETEIPSTTLSLGIDTERLDALPAFEQAAVRNAVRTLHRLDALSTELGACLAALATPRRERGRPPKVAPAAARRPDADSYAAAIRIMAGVWLSIVVWIYLDPPGHIGFVVFTGVHALLGLMAQRMNWVRFIVTNTLGIVMAGLLYLLVMPHLSSFLGFSILLFVFTTIIYGVFWEPRVTMMKFAAIVPFIMLTGLQNTQTYNFASFANNAACMLLSMIFAAATSVIPFSLRPESMFVRLAGRFFRQAGESLAILAPSATANGIPASRPTIAAMRHTVGNLGGWAHNVDYRSLPGDAPQKAASLVTSLNGITHRFRALAEAAAAPQPLGEHIQANLDAWREAIAALLRPWATGRFATDATPDPQALQRSVTALEHHFEETFRTIPQGHDAQAYANAYRLLGGCRGLYKALVAHAALTQDFDWDRWRETRL